MTKCKCKSLTKTCKENETRLIMSLCWHLKWSISYFTPSQYPLAIQSNTFCEIADYPMIWLIRRLTVFHQKLREAGVEVPEVGGKTKAGVEEDKKNLTEEVRKLKDELDATKKGTVWLWITRTLNRVLFTYSKTKQSYCVLVYGCTVSS